MLVELAGGRGSAQAAAAVTQLRLRSQHRQLEIAGVAVRRAQGDCWDVTGKRTKKTDGGKDGDECEGEGGWICEHGQKITKFTDHRFQLCESHVMTRLPSYLKHYSLQCFAASSVHETIDDCLFLAMLAVGNGRGLLIPTGV